MQLATSGMYYIKGVSSHHGCPDVDQARHGNHPSRNRQSTVAIDSALICKGASATLTATSPGNSIEWLNVAISPVVVVNPLVTTTYQAVATDALGCADTASVTSTSETFHSYPYSKP